MTEPQDQADGQFTDTLSTVVTRKAPVVSTVVEYPKLLKFDPSSIRVFLREYKNYKNDLAYRSSQFSLSDGSAAPSKPVEMKYCVEVGYLESLIDLDIIPGCSSFETLDEKHLESYLLQRRQSFQNALNHSPSAHRANKSPLEIFTGLKPVSTLGSFSRTANGSVLTVEEAELERLFSVKLLQQKLDDLHPLVSTSLAEHRAMAWKSASRGNFANFERGDFVLLAREEFHEGEKLCLRWRGPRRVLRPISDHVYLIEDLRNGETEEAHACRLKFYRDSSLDATELHSHCVHSEHGMQVQRLKNLEMHDGKLFVGVRWKGLPPEEDTLEPLAGIAKDVPEMLRRLLKRKNAKRALVAEAKKQISI